MSQKHPIKNGIRRGVQMGTAPDPQRLRELREKARSSDYTAQAWNLVGQSLRGATSAGIKHSRI